MGESMLTVFIWDFRGKDVAWGHASVLVNRTYMSWWPEGRNRLRSKVHPNIYSAGPFRDRKFAEDVEAEGQQPDQSIELAGLDEGAIEDWWQSFGLTGDGVLYYGPLLNWETLTLNCSTVAAHALTVGGGKNFASWTKVWNVVWTPRDVLHYARAIQAGLQRQVKK